MTKYTGKTYSKDDVFAAECLGGGWDVWVLVDGEWQYDNYYCEELPDWASGGRPRKTVK